MHRVARVRGLCVCVCAGAPQSSFGRKRQEKESVREENEEEEAKKSGLPRLLCNPDDAAEMRSTARRRSRAPGVRGTGVGWAGLSVTECVEIKDKTNESTKKSLSFTQAQTRREHCCQVWRQRKKEGEDRFAHTPRVTVTFRRASLT